ncbi:heme lyase CcmF/NrfE family subunit [Paracoccaceae bacterium GXU_MW_L88]
MTAEIGHFALILAFAFALAQAVLAFAGAQRGWRGVMEVGRIAALAQLALVLIAFAALTKAFVTSDFSVKLVADNSHTDKPLIYKITGVWGNHEGSLLLWVLILAAFGAAVALRGSALPRRLRANVLAVQGSIGVAFMAFMLFTSNPFLRLARPPLEGADLNPLLQDPGLAIHPPFLYLGYVGFSVAFSFAMAALIEGRVDSAWARWVRPWTLAAWIFLTIGITLGSWWAYYELGWGGFWFWDPVENASLMPWLTGTALLHSALVVERRETLKVWTILLAIIAFGFSLIGTFLVRSGIITSVHAFAVDPERGLALLGIFAVFMGAAFTLFALRASSLRQGAPFAPVSREGALLINNLLLITACLVVFMGTLWPLIIEIGFGGRVSVGAPFFNQSVTPIFAMLLLVLPIGALLPWRRGRFARLPQTVLYAAGLAIAIGALAFAIRSGRSAIGPLGAAFGLWVTLGALVDLGEKARWNLGRLTRIRAADWGRVLAHGGLGIFAIGAVMVTTWAREDVAALGPRGTLEIGGYTLTLVDITNANGPNYQGLDGDVQVSRGGAEIARLVPEKRFYPGAGMPTTEAAIRSTIKEDLYLALGDRQDDGRWVLRAYIKPLALWLWIGGALMALGGMLSLSDRRRRKGEVVR